MAKQDFLANLRIARSSFRRPRIGMIRGRPDPEMNASQSARRAYWLTEKAVAGFDPGDFPELGPAQSADLERAVSAFRTVADQVSPTQSPTLEQYLTATDALTRILFILRDNLPDDGERHDIQQAMQEIGLPDWVVKWAYEVGEDADGGPAVYFEILVDERRVTREDLGRLAARLTIAIQSRLQQAGINRWPYIRVQSTQEIGVGLE